MVPPRGRMPARRGRRAAESAVDQAAPAVQDAGHLVAAVDRAPGDGADHRVQPGAVATAGEDPDPHRGHASPGFGPHHRQRLGAIRVLSSGRAEVAEPVDAPDSKSGGGNLVWVRVPPSALPDTTRATFPDKQAVSRLATRLAHGAY